MDGQNQVIPFSTIKKEYVWSLDHESKNILAFEFF